MCQHSVGIGGKNLETGRFDRSRSPYPRRLKIGLSVIRGRCHV
jgi:hypothetical protein